MNKEKKFDSVFKSTAISSEDVQNMIANINKYFGKRIKQIKDIASTPIKDAEPNDK